MLVVIVFGEIEMHIALPVRRRTILTRPEAQAEHDDSHEEDDAFHFNANL